MPENYPEQLAAWMREQNTAGRSLNKPTFFAVKTDVIAAMDAGFLPKDIWGNLRACGRIDFSYDTFLRFIKQYIAAPDSRTPPTSSVRNTATKNRLDSLTAQNRTAASSRMPAGFVYNPIPNKEDLI